MKNRFVFFFAIVFIFGCSGLQSTFKPKIIPSTTTPIILPTITPTLNLENQYISSLQDFSPRFEWKFVDNLRMAVLIPNNWIFTEEKQFLPVYDGFYVTQGNLDVNGRFLIGFTAFMYKGFTNPNDSENFAKQLLEKIRELETTKNIIQDWDYKTDNTTEYHLRIEREFPEEIEENKYKIIHYMTFAYKDRVYLWSLESPAGIFDYVLNDYGIIFKRAEWFP